VLYKYLNPNLLLVSTKNVAAKTVALYLLDSTSGQVLWTVKHDNIDTTQPISAVVSENWLVYSLFAAPLSVTAESKNSAVQAYQIHVTDLYESSIPNNRGPLGASSNFSTIAPLDDAEASIYVPYAISSSFVFPEPVSALGVSQTRQGITTRQVLAVLPRSGGILALPRMVLDPRRPMLDKNEKPSAAMMEEGLIPYAPHIEIDPRSIITHNREVIGVRGLITAPALMESTSLVLAYGVDVFGTRVTPSGAFDVLGKGFNRLALVSTVLGLAVGVRFVAPMVRRKQIDLRWSM
jgi:hypothetical protein